MTKPITILCLASYEKGHEFLRECRRQGCRVLLLTSQSIPRESWPLESIDEIFLMPDNNKQWNREDAIKSVSYLARTESIDRIVPLDDFDLELAATLREHLRIPGMGETSTRYFRDKLAMRTRAREKKIDVPEFTQVLNHRRLSEFMANVPGPWFLKPRSEASAVGIRKISHPDELWPILEELGDRQSHFLLERFIPGDIYHVDSVVSEREVVFAATHRYGKTPFDISHFGGVFTTKTVLRGSEDDLALVKHNAEVLRGMGMVRGVSHTEFIKSHENGRFYFLETAARVGGANIVELVEAATNINLWAEWAKLEIIMGERPYELPPVRYDYAGLMVSLAKQENPDTSAYDDPEIVWRMQKHHHAGLIVMSPDPGRIDQLIKEYTTRFYDDFYATEPAPDRIRG
ncbi:MAG: hypothetical protein QOH96_1369 [Blastocatellia bacterium]|jgi:biotin carboxylase|nr:hypothetical protein [Blastocatellia bacterium]